VISFLLGVLAGVVVAAAGASIGTARRRWNEAALWRTAHRGRRAVRSLLSIELDLDGRNPFGRGRLNRLAESFRARTGTAHPDSHGAEEVKGAEALLKHLADHRARAYLIKSESGFGKTVLGMTLSLLGTRAGLTPVYVDFADTNTENPLEKVENLLRSMRGKRDGAPPRGRPLFIIDALNETVAPYRLCERLAQRKSELDRLNAKFLFLFSFRHPSYPGRVRQALLNHDLGPIEELELLFDPKVENDLAFSYDPGAPGVLGSELRAYCSRFAESNLSRADLRAFLDWRAAHPTAAAETAPAPPALRFEQVIHPRLRSGAALKRICNLAFDLLSEEVTTSTLAELAAGHDSTAEEIRHWTERSGLGDRVHCDEEYLRFKDEPTIRVLAALSVAYRLKAGDSPATLHGRASYDVCAPYLQSAARWIATRNGATAEVDLELIGSAVARALRGRDAPYSFYAIALCSETSAEFEHRRKDLDARLFEQMIIAIDDDRCHSCEESLERAGMQGEKPGLDPVLDQLFEVMAAYSRRAVNLLLATLTDSNPLVKSQAAYLLLAWVANLELTIDEPDRMALESIPEGLPSNDGNLHFRFHEVEILEALLVRFPEVGKLKQRALAKADELGAAAADPASVRGVREVHSVCQRLVTLRARSLVTPQGKPRYEEIESPLHDCIEEITSDPRFRSLGGSADAEARLECWEVTLGTAVWLCLRSHRTVELTDFVEAALKHRFWIVRWWAFEGLLKIARSAGRTGKRDLLERCARRATEALCGNIEPMGLKHRQCAMTKRMLDDDDAEVYSITREALLDAFELHLCGAAKRAFVDGYYEAIGTSPDSYLEEFFRRMTEIVPVDFDGSTQLDRRITGR
jgi:hypothetical protein